ncbi:MAG: NYN domain-containing protein [Aeromicrobium sp.]|uniref:NYN domain-containing protein n=1 Tax=Aeromicrobium sp. TaxID=1871063 RepID=UPI0039E4FE34
MAAPDLRMAVLIDADNAQAAKVEAILRRVAEYGKANVRKAYGNWRKDELKGWSEKLHEFAIAPVQQFDLTKGKNASDIAMVIDAMDLLHAGDVDGFAIVSSDADFTPLVMRLRQSGAEVIGFGQAKAPEPFRNACSRFFEVEALGADGDDEDQSGESERPQRRTGAQLKQNSRLMSLMRSAIDDAADDDGWATLSQVSNLIRNQSSFEPRNFGYAKFSDLVKAIDLFEVAGDNKRVRRKPKRTRG